MKFTLALTTLIALTGSLFAARTILWCDYGGGTVSILSAAGEIEWQVQAKQPQDCWQLPSGNILFAYRCGAKEVTRDQNVVWEYVACEKVECHACQPLPDGSVLIVECGSSRIIEVDPACKTVWQLTENDLPGHPLRLMAGCHCLPNGNTIFANYLGHGHLGEQAQFIEVTPDKKSSGPLRTKGASKPSIKSWHWMTVAM
jgi:hypothetical protein